MLALGGGFIFLLPISMSHYTIANSSWALFILEGGGSSSVYQAAQTIRLTNIVTNIKASHPGIVCWPSWESGSTISNFCI